MELNRYIDHTLLRSDATPADIERLCRQAMEYNFHCVVVNPVYISQSVGILKGSGVKTCSVAGFPLGAGLTEIKIAEAAKAEEHGATEIDVVANIGWIQSGRFSDVAGELTSIRRRLATETILKVIMETPLVSSEHWPDTVEAIIGSGANFMKSGTGFFGAVGVEHISTLRRLCAGRIKIKAAGGIRTAADALALIDVGAVRLGTSASVSIMRDLPASKM